MMARVTHRRPRDIDRELAELRAKIFRDALLRSMMR
jgi:hypothetical protein